MALGHLNHDSSKTFQENHPNFYVGTYNLCKKKHAKFRVDTCNATNAIQETQWGLIRPPPPPQGGRG